MSHLRTFQKLAGIRPTVEAISDLAGVKFRERRIGNGRVAFELYAAAPVELTPYEKDWSISPGSFKPNQFARVEVEKKLLTLHRIEEFAAVLQTPRTKSTPPKRDPEFSHVISLVGAVVGSGFASKGYGLALWLKALKWATDKGYWLASDYGGGDSADAQRTWRALFKYAQHSYEGVYWRALLPPKASQEFFAAYGLNSAGEKALAAMEKNA